MMTQLLSTRPKWAAVLVLGAAVFFSGVARGGDITGIVSFGDSLSDTGNVYTATGGAQPAPPEYYQGRYSNGIIWNEYLAKDLGVAAPTASLLGGTDYAWGGAETGLTGLSSQGTPNIGTQITTYLSANTPTASQLFTIWGGANDFGHGGQTDPTSPVANIGTEISWLAKAGAQQFMVANLPLLGEIPYSIQNLPMAQRQGLDYLSVKFDTLLQSEVTQLQQSLGVQIHLLDILGLFNSVIADPSQYGLTNVTQSAYENGVLSGQGYLFWDENHPTTQIDSIIGFAASQLVPEPSSIVLLGTSICGIAVWARFRSRAATSRHSCANAAIEPATHSSRQL